MTEKRGRPGGWWWSLRSPVAVALASVTVLTACSSTPEPSPFTASPAASTPTSAAPVAPVAEAPAETRAATTSTTASPGGPPPTTATTVVVSPLASPSRSTGPVLRLTYPGIKRLVFVHSDLNATVTGRAALNVVAAYNSALATSLVTKTTKQLRALSDSACAQCQEDITRIDQFIKDGNTIINSDGSTGFASAAIDLMEVYDGTKSTVVVNTYELSSRFLTHGRTVDRSSALVVDLMYSTEQVGERTVISAINPTS